MHFTVDVDGSDIYIVLQHMCLNVLVDDGKYDVWVTVVTVTVRYRCSRCEILSSVLFDVKHGSSIPLAW